MEEVESRVYEGDVEIWCGEREVREEEEEDDWWWWWWGSFYLFLIVWLFLGRRWRRFGLLRGRVGGRSGLPLWSFVVLFGRVC